MKRIEKKLRKKFGATIMQYQLVNEGDHILVAVSGGKDSLLMLTFFNEIKKKAPIDFKITACHLKNELTEEKLREETAHYLESYFKDLKVDYIIDDLPVISTSSKDKKIGCFWCSWQRRKTIFNIAGERKMNKVAFGHHKDDIIQTLLMNLFYHGKFGTMPIKLKIFNGEITLIRPMGALKEAEIKKVVNYMGLKVSTCLCPYAKDNKREHMKEVINNLEKEYKSIRNCLFKASHSNNIDSNYLN